MKDNNNSDLWQSAPSATELILRRKKLSKLDERALTDLIADSVRVVREKDIQGLLGLIALDFEMDAIEMINGQKIRKVQDRDRFEIGVHGWLEGCDTSQYTVEIVSNMVNGDKGAVEVVIYDPGNPMIRDYFGGYVKETIEVGLFDGVPVIEKIKVHGNDA